jgi:hypothetical protein
VYGFEDATGELDLVFLGRREVPGLGPGVRLTVEGTAAMDNERFVVLNPLYEVEAGPGSETSKRREPPWGVGAG